MINTEFLNRLSYIYNQCTFIIDSIFKEQFNVSGNIAIFSQSDAEYLEFSKIAREITNPSANPNQKYFELIEPITLTNNKSIATFTHLYIRKYDPSMYGKNKGDIDFITEYENYNSLKQRVINGEFTGASMYDRPGWDTIQMILEDIDVVAYLSTIVMAEKVRIKFDSLTNL